MLPRHLGKGNQIKLYWRQNMPANNPHEQVNQSYKYTSEDISNILNCRFAEARKNNAAFKKKGYCLQFQDTASHAGLSCSLAKLSEIKNKFVSVLYRTSDDIWVGVHLEFDGESKLEKSYYLDSKLLDDDAIPTNILQSFHKAFPNNSLEIAICMQQPEDDYTSSGAYVVENLILYAQGLDVPEEPISVVDIRTQHISSLKHYKPEYYKGFVYRQFNNMSAQDDEAQTILLLKRLGDALLTKSDTAFRDERIREFFKRNYNLVKVGNKLQFKPKNATAASSVNGFVEIKQNEYIQNISQELRVSLWNLDTYAQLNVTPLAKTRDTLLAATAVVGVARGVFGVQGIARRAAIATAIEAGGAATIITGVAGFAGQMLRYMLNPALLVPAFALQAVVDQVNTTGNAVNACIAEALELYKKGIVTGNSQNYVDADRSLRAAIGLAVDAQADQISTLRYMQLSNDQYAQVCLLLGIINVQLARNYAYAFLQQAAKYAKDSKLKEISLLWLIKSLKNFQSSDLVYEQFDEQIFTVDKQKSLTDAVGQLSKCSDLITNCNTYVLHASGFVLNFLINYNIDAEEVIKFFACEYAGVLNLLPENGALLDGILIFLQGIFLKHFGKDSKEHFGASFDYLYSVIQTPTHSEGEYAYLIAHELLHYIRRNNLVPLKDVIPIPELQEVLKVQLETKIIHTQI